MSKQVLSEYTCTKSLCGQNLYDLSCMSFTFARASRIYENRKSGTGRLKFSSNVSEKLCRLNTNTLKI